MPHSLRTRFQDTVPYAANAKQVRRIQRGLIIRELMLRLYGTLTCTLGNNTLANTLRGDELAVISKLEIIANSSDVIFSMPGWAMYWYNYLWHKYKPIKTNQIGDGIATPVFETLLKIPFWDQRNFSPMDTALDSSQLTDLRCEITWADHTAINASATAFTTAPNVDIFSLESDAVSGAYKPGGPFTLARKVTMTAAVSAANPAYRFDLPVGPLYRAFLINVQDTSTPPVDKGGSAFTGAANPAGVGAGILKNIQVAAGTTTFYDAAESVIRQGERMMHPFGFEANQALAYATRAGANGETTIASAAVMGDEQTVRQNLKENADGWYVVDLAPDGLLTEAIDTQSFGDFKLIFNLTAAANLTVIPIQLYPPRV